MIRPVPGPAFLAGVAVSTWLDTASPADPVGALLIGHVHPQLGGHTVAAIETALLGLAEAMTLRPVTEPMPDIGTRVLMRGPMVALDYGHPAYTLRLPSPGPGWQAHVAAGGPVCLTLGLDPLPPGAGPDSIGAYLHRTAATGRAYRGMTALRQHPDAESSPSARGTDMDDTPPTPASCEGCGTLHDVAETYLHADSGPGWEFSLCQRCADAPPTGLYHEAHIDRLLTWSEAPHETAVDGRGDL
ncbi:hypothetical protein [Streptomyces sp. NPDC048644]|uniref:hypothetical protein n=1 Tax=Streptomyces sp. NPDC048644 TaxID=3365582 RepID=UPI00372250BD